MLTLFLGPVSCFLQSLDSINLSICRPKRSRGVDVFSGCIIRTAAASLEALWVGRDDLWFVAFDTWPSDVFNPIGLYADYKRFFVVVVVVVRVSIVSV